MQTSLAKIPALALLLVSLASPTLTANTWVDPEVATKENPDFLIQGEYVGESGGKKTGVQASDIGGGRFLVATYQGGLPGAGWDQSKIDSQVLDREALKKKTASLKRIERVSKTMGLKAPEGAVIIFNGEKSDVIQGTVDKGLMWPPSVTTRTFGSFDMHLEFRMPYKPATPITNQDRGNSGVYIFDRYECQLLDTFAMDYNPEKHPLPLQSDKKQWGGCLYLFKVADLNMCYPPLQWQTYDIQFTAPVFTDGKKTANARITLFHNGVKIHDNVELPKGTGMGGSRPEIASGIINFQGHGNPVAFRNVWIKEK